MACLLLIADEPFFSGSFSVGSFAIFLSIGFWLYSGLNVLALLLHPLSMNKLHHLLCSVTFLAITCQPVFAQTDSFLKDFAERWETSRQYIIKVAEAMPESNYSFKPTAEEMTFAQQLMHIAVIIDWHAFSKADGQEYKPRWEEFKAEGRSKKEMIDMVNREFERTAKLLASFDPARLGETGSYDKFTRTRRQFLLLMADHVTHHRAQMLIYMRLKGITPPKYWEFQ